MKQLPGIILLLAFLAAPAQAAQQVGSVVAMRGSVAIERPSGRVEAKVKSAFEFQDTVVTSAASRAKLLFVDDSVLTLGDSSRMNIKEFIHSSGDRGKSIFNLLDGKMRAVVGKTRFQVETPTAVAAARGTVIYFETGKIGKRYYTKIICMEGVVEVRSKVPGDTAVAELEEGDSITVMEGERLGLSGSTGKLSSNSQSSNMTPVVPAAADVPVEQAEVLRTGLADQAIARNNTSIGLPEIRVPVVTLSEIMPPPIPGSELPFPVVPVAGQQQLPVQPAGVTIHINF